jgi:hypothetical protein
MYIIKVLLSDDAKVLALLFFFKSVFTISSPLYSHMGFGNDSSIFIKEPSGIPTEISLNIDVKSGLWLGLSVFESGGGDPHYL